MIAAEIEMVVHRWHGATLRAMLDPVLGVVVVVDPAPGVILTLIDLGGMLDELTGILDPLPVKVYASSALPAEYQAGLSSLDQIGPAIESAIGRRQLASFADVARSFVTWCDAPLPPDVTASKIFADLRRHLVTIYGAALALIEPPEFEDSPNPRRTVRSARVSHVRDKLELLGVRRYTYAFRPTVDADVLTDGDLWDDVNSVLTWIQLGLELYDAGQIERAWYDWWWDLDGHSGQHLANALYVLQAEATYGDRKVGRND